MFGIFMMFFSDFVEEGDFIGLFKFFKVVFFMLYLYNRVKYVYVVFLCFVKIYVILSEKFVFEVSYNRYFNNFGKLGVNIFLDLRIEYLNRLLKLVLK